MKSGATAILVKCTSRQNRYDLLSRVTAEIAKDAHILVICPRNYLHIVGKTFDQHVPASDVGRWDEGRRVTLADLSHFQAVDFSRIGSFVVLASPRRLNDADRKIWNDAATRLAEMASQKVKIEFALAHSCWMVGVPDIVIQGAGRISDIE